MDEDEEEFYDSLDEDHNVEDVHKITKIDSEIEPKNYTSDSITSSIITVTSSLRKESREPILQKSTKIPLYVGETDSNEIKTNKKANLIVPSTAKTSSTCISCETSGKQCNKIKLENVVTKKRADTSYWTMYCQKNGIPCDDDGNTDNARSSYGSTTNRTFSTFLSNCCLSGNTWDAPSLFEKYIPKTYATQKNEILPTYEEQDSEKISNITKCESKSIGVENLKSVSQIEIRQTTSTPSKISSKVIKSKSNTSNLSSLRQLSLKTVGPNETKLELIKKQQEYGLRANNRNRVRIIQNLSKIKQATEENKLKPNISR